MTTTDLLTVEDVAAALRISEEQVRRRTKAEGWPHVRFSRKSIRFRAEHVEQIIAMHDHTPEVAQTVGLPGQTARSRRRSA